jgi:hypothetical protein
VCVCVCLLVSGLSTCWDMSLRVHHEFGGIVDCFRFGSWPPGTADSSFHSIRSAHRFSSFARVIQSSRRVDPNLSVSRVLAHPCLMVCCSLPSGLAAGQQAASILRGPRLSSISLSFWSHLHLRSSNIWCIVRLLPAHLRASWFAVLFSFAW